MLKKLLQKAPQRPDIVVITSTASVLLPHAAVVQSSWQPTWSQINLLSALALTITQHQGTPTTPLDTAIHTYVISKGTSMRTGEPMTSYTFTAKVAMSGNAWHRGREYELAIKGAPEAVLARCDLTESEREDIQRAAAHMAAEGCQVVAVAYAVLRSAPASLGGPRQKNMFAFAGLIGIGTVVHPKARQAVRNALQAGISVRMLSGGHLETAYTLGRQLGLVTERAQALDSRTLHHMSPEAAEKAIGSTLIFAEATPENKDSVITALKKNHTVTVIDDQIMPSISLKS